MNLKTQLNLASVLAVTLGSGALAATESQPEYKRGYADCAAGRFDPARQSESYNKGCDAAFVAKAMSGATPGPNEAAPAEKPSVDK